MLSLKHELATEEKYFSSEEDKIVVLRLVVSLGEVYVHK